jgi:hypothetical protein
LVFFLNPWKSKENTDRMRSMARKSTTAAPAATTDGAKPVVRRRRRTVNHAAQTPALISALMKGAGRPITPGEAVTLINWARGVHAERAALAKLKPRSRAVKPEVLAARRAEHEVNQALLDGVVAGTLAVGIAEDGALTFQSA